MDNQDYYETSNITIVPSEDFMWLWGFSDEDMSTMDVKNVENNLTYFKELQYQDKISYVSMLLDDYNKLVGKYDAIIQELDDMKNDNAPCESCEKVCEGDMPQGIVREYGDIANLMIDFFEDKDYYDTNSLFAVIDFVKYVRDCDYK